MPFDELVGRAGTLPPAQIVSDEPNANTGVTIGLTVTDKLADKAHCPLAGVNV